MLFLSLTYSVRLMVTTPSNSWWLSYLIKNEIVNHLSASISLPVLPSPLDDACILKSVEYLPVSPNFTLCPFTSTTGEVWLVVCNFLKLFVILSFDTVKTRKHLVPSNMGKLRSSETFTSSAKGILLIAADTLPNEYVPTPPALLPASWRVFSGRKPFSVLRSPFSVSVTPSVSRFLFPVFSFPCLGLIKRVLCCSDGTESKGTNSTNDSHRGSSTHPTPQNVQLEEALQGEVVWHW